MPWQQHVADVALEINPDSGRLAYRDVRLTVPRQSGKTTMILPIVIMRAFAQEQLGGRQNMLYAAQTRQKARKKWEKDYVTALRSCKSLRGKFDVRLANGDEHVKFQGGSTFGVEATTEKSGHGETLDLAIQDEAFALVDDRMDQAFRPPMVTRPSPQFWIVSTAGTDASLYLKRKVAEGRASVESDLDRGVAYFEWSADPDADPASPATWRSCMPALGYTVDEETILGEFLGMQSDLPGFCRAYLNLWQTDVAQTVIPLAWWRQRKDAESVMTGAPVLAVDVSPDRSTASIVAVGDSTTTAGAAHIEIIDGAREGTDWCVPRLIELNRKWKPKAIVLDKAGPAGSFIQDLKAADIEPLVIQSQQLTQACGSLYDMSRDGGFVHLGDQILETALRGAATRLIGDAWAWRRRISTADITPLVAATIGLWAHAEADEGVALWVSYA